MHESVEMFSLWKFVLPGHRMLRNTGMHSSTDVVIVGFDLQYHNDMNRSNLLLLYCEKEWAIRLSSMDAI